MRSILTAVIATLFVACLCASAEACPLRGVGRLAVGAAKAPLKLVKARPARRALGRLLGR